MNGSEHYAEAEKYIESASQPGLDQEWVMARLAKGGQAVPDTTSPDLATVRRLVLSDMQAEVTAWCERKGWKGEGSAPVTFGDTMALLHSEVSEALEAFRDWGLADATASEGRHTPGCAASDHTVFGGSLSDRPGCTCGAVAKPEGVGSEFADILIRLLDDCDRWGVDLAAEYERKMAYNETRAFQHGGRAL